MTFSHPDSPHDEAYESFWRALVEWDVAPDKEDGVLTYDDVREELHARAADQECALTVWINKRSDSEITWYQFHHLPGQNAQKTVYCCAHCGQLTRINDRNRMRVLRTHDCQNGSDSRTSSKKGELVKIKGYSRNHFAGGGVSDRRMRTSRRNSKGRRTSRSAGSRAATRGSTRASADRDVDPALSPGPLSTTPFAAGYGGGAAHPAVYYATSPLATSPPPSAHISALTDRTASPPPPAAGVPAYSNIHTGFAAAPQTAYTNNSGALSPLAGAVSSPSPMYGHGGAALSPPPTSNVAAMPLTYFVAGGGSTTYSTTASTTANNSTSNNIGSNNSASGSRSGSGSPPLTSPVYTMYADGDGVAKVYTIEQQAASQQQQQQANNDAATYAAHKLLNRNNNNTSGSGSGSGSERSASSSPPIPTVRALSPTALESDNSTMQMDSSSSVVGSASTQTASATTGGDSSVFTGTVKGIDSGYALDCGMTDAFDSAVSPLDVVKPQLATVLGTDPCSALPFASEDAALVSDFATAQSGSIDPDLACLATNVEANTFANMMAYGAEEAETAPAPDASSSSFFSLFGFS